MPLATTYLGLQLKNPLVPSSSPLSRDLAMLRQMEDAGAGAIVLYSLFAEQINRANGRKIAAPPAVTTYDNDPEDYFKHIQKAKAALDIPVIASLNSGRIGAWIQMAREIEAAGADALELNLYFIPADPHLTGPIVEQLYLDVLYEVKKVVTIPIALKLSPFFSSMAHMASRLDKNGADGLVFFNRFYQPDLDVEKWQIEPKIELSSSAELRLPLRWIAILYGRVQADLALSTGVHTYTEIVKGLAAGATVTMIASELLRNGIQRLRMMRSGLASWLKENNVESINQLRGRLSLSDEKKPMSFERDSYLRVLSSYEPSNLSPFGASSINPDV